MPCYRERQSLRIVNMYISYSQNNVIRNDGVEKYLQFGYLEICYPDGIVLIGSR